MAVASRPPVAAVADKNRSGMPKGHTLALVTDGTVRGCFSNVPPNGFAVRLSGHANKNAARLAARAPDITIWDACSSQADGGWLRH